ncbi:MAG: PEP-CTERM sorting domain-containing protein [Rhodospirillales bacterium]|nr:PEP-CTERM sorting domain-containing protein [Acetobacter sp.]
MRVASVIVGLVLLGLSPVVGRADNLVSNGNFENLKQSGVSSEFGSRYSSQQVTGWQTGGYNFVFTPGAADTTGAPGRGRPVILWGPGSGSVNGLPATSPSGGNFLALDGDVDPGAVTQTINGLLPNHVATVFFNWAGAQQSGYTGPTTEQLQVSLGDQTQSTPVLQNVSKGFTGWQPQEFSFLPTSATEVLSFLAIGTPAGVPPFSLLDGVTLSESPEPSSWPMLLLAGGIAVGLSSFLRRVRRAFVPASDRAK